AEDLAAATSKDSKGTFNPGTGVATGQGSAGASASAKSSAALLPSTSSSSGSGDITEVDFRRAGARQRLESSYATIAETAWSLVAAFPEYPGCGEIPSRPCLSAATTVPPLQI